MQREKKEIRPNTDVKSKGRKSKKSIEAASKIQKFYRNEKERNKLFTLQPEKIWNTKFSYTLTNNLNFDNNKTPEENFASVFQYYKIANFLISKLKEFKGNLKLNIGYYVRILKEVKDEETNNTRVEEQPYKDIIESIQIYNKSDIYAYFEKVYENVERISDGEIYKYQEVIAIKEIYIDIHKTKPLNGSSYIPLPEWVANKKALNGSLIKKQ